MLVPVTLQRCKAHQKQSMKKLLLLVTLCAASVYAQNSEVFGSVGVSVPRNPLVTKLNAGFGYGYSFSKPYSKLVFDEVTVSYGYTALGYGVPFSKASYGAHTVLGSVKRNMTNSHSLLTPFVEVGAGTTTFDTPSREFTKFTTKFGGGLSYDLSKSRCTFFKKTKGMIMSLGFFGNKIETVPVYFSTSLGISKRF
jgi:hypothetical protein